MVESAPLAYMRRSLIMYVNRERFAITNLGYSLPILILLMLHGLNFYVWSLYLSLARLGTLALTERMVTCRRRCNTWYTVLYQPEGVPKIGPCSGDSLWALTNKRRSYAVPSLLCLVLTRQSPGEFVWYRVQDQQAVSGRPRQ